MRRWHQDRLSNGLSVLYAQDPTMPISHASLLMRAGSFQESAAQAGLCSLTIDLMMEGTPKRTARQIADAMESIGASLGAQAHEDYTDFGFVVPSQHLPRALDILADVMQNPSFREKDIQKEKREVLADLQSRSDAIFNVAHDAIMPLLFPNHAYGRPLEGKAETVKKFKRQDFKEWHAQALYPGRMILSLMGPNPWEQTRRMVSRYFGEPSYHRHPRGSLAGIQRLPFEAARPPMTLLRHLVSGGRQRLSGVGGDTKIIRSPFKQAYYMKAYRAPCYGEPSYLPLKLLNIIVGGGMSSRLFLELREKRGLAYEISSYYSSRTYGGAWVFYMGLPDEKRKAASVGLRDLLERVSARGVLASELEQAKHMMRGGYLMENQTRRRQSWYAAWWMLQGKDPDYGCEFLKSLNQVSLADVRHVAQWVLGGPSVTVEVVPQ